MTDLEDDNNLNNQPQNDLEVERADEDLKRISQANEFLTLLYPDIRREEETAELSPENKDSLYFSPNYEPTIEEVEERKKNIEKSPYELRELPEPTVENNTVLRNLEDRAKTPEIEKHKTLRERFDQMLSDQIYVRNFSDNGLSKKYGKEVLQIHKEKYPNVQAKYHLPSFLTTVKEYYQDQSPGEKQNLKDGTTVEDVVFTALERMEILGDHPDIYNLAKGIHGSDPTLNQIPVEDFIKLGITDDETWNSLIDELKDIPYIREYSLRFWDYTRLLQIGLDEEQKEQLEHLKRYRSYLFQTKEEEIQDWEYFIIIENLLCKKESFDSFKNQQEIRTGCNFSAHYISNEIDKNELAFRLLSLKYGVDLYSNAYDIFPHREKLRDMILENAKSGNDTELINEQFKLWKNLASLNIPLYPSEQEAILDVLTNKENNQIITKALLYSKGGLDISQSILALKLGRFEKRNNPNLKKDFLDSISFSLSSFEERIIAVSQRVDGLEIKDAKELEEIFKKSDVEKIGSLSTLSLLENYSQNPPNKEQLKLMFNIENGKFSINEKFFEYGFTTLLENRGAYDIKAPFKKTISIQEIKNPETQRYWNIINQLLDNSNEFQAVNLINQSIEMGFDYDKILDTYVGIKDGQEFLNATHYYKRLQNYVDSAQYLTPSCFPDLNYLIRENDLDCIDNIQDKMFLNFLKKYGNSLEEYSMNEILLDQNGDIIFDSNLSDSFFNKYVTMIEKDGQKKYLYNENFLEAMCYDKPYFLTTNPDLISDQLLSTIENPEEKEFWTFIKGSNIIYSSVFFELRAINGYDTSLYEFLNNYTNIVEINSEKKRLPNVEFLRTYIAYERPNLLNNVNIIFTKELLDSFTPVDKFFWERFLKINDIVSRDSLLDYYSTNEDLDLDQLKSVFALTEKILNSPSAEIIRLKDNIISSLSSKGKSLEESIADYEVLENIFVKNNSPVSISRWRVFNTLYLDNLIDYAKDQKISPLLLSILSNEQYSREQMKEIISRTIQKDLLNISKDSVDENLYNFLTRLKDGTEALSFYDSYIQEGFSDSEIIESLGEREKEYLNKSLDIFFTASNKSSHNQEVSSRIIELRTLLGIGANQSLTSGIYNSYLYPLTDNTTGDITTDIEKIQSEMLSVKEIAHQRGLKYAREGVSIKKGDLLKNVGSLNGIIDNGIYAKDFLGANAGQDLTPYDTDTVMVTDEVLIFSQAIKDYKLHGYGDVTLVIRDKGQFNNPSEKNLSTNINSKYELIHSQVISQNHYGVRTGIATTEIDYIVIPEYYQGEPLSDIKFRIASKGIYIPVVNSEGKIIYTPEEYEKQRETFAGVTGIAYKPYTVDTGRNGLTPIIKELEDKIINDREKTNRISQELQLSIEKELVTRNLVFEDSISGLAGVRIEHIGSTSRSTHLVGSSDFDFSILMDRSQLGNIDSNGKYQLINNVVDSLGTIEQNGEFHNVGENTTQMVGAKIKLKSGEIVEFDLAITDKGTNINGSNSHELVIDRLNNIKEIEGEEKYNFVISNILIAKKVLKEYHCYKKGFREGGLGGIGIENWILQHHGNFEIASDQFLRAATNTDGTIVSFETFKTNYTIYDPGKDIRTGANDNFVSNNMNESGYKRMVEAVMAFRKGEIDLVKLFNK